MRVKKATLYYCDFCKRRSFTRPRMYKHEVGCTANPNRICGMCRLAKLDQPLLSDLVKLDSFAALKEATKGCPACILAAIRQDKRAPTSDSEDAFLRAPLEHDGEWKWNEARTAWVNKHSRFKNDLMDYDC